MPLIPTESDKINDPKFLHELVTAAREMAEYINSLLGSDVNPTLKLLNFDGTTKEVTRFDDPADYSLAHINTYVGTPERFRDYWRQLADVVAQPAQVTEVLDTSGLASGVFGPEDRTVTTIDYYYPGPGFEQRHRKIEYTVSGALDPRLTEEVFENPRPEEPAWSGAWPGGYYYTTLPQLVDAFYSLQVERLPETVSIKPFYYQGGSVHEEKHELNADGVLIPYKPPYRYDMVSAGNSLGWTTYIRNHSDEAIEVPFSASVSTGGSYNTYCNAFYGESNYAFFIAWGQDNTGSVTGAVPVPPRSIVRIVVGGWGGFSREEEIPVDPENPGSLDPNRFIDQVPTVTISLSVGEFSLARSFPPLLN